MSGSRWIAELMDNDEVHVRPIGDLIDHPADDCPCGPTTEPVERADGSIGWLVTHHSLDDREQRERKL